MYTRNGVIGWRVNFILPEIWQQSSFFFCSHFGLLPKTLNTSNLDTCMYIKNLCQRYVLVTHNKASAGPRSASACDAPNTTTRALRVSALHAVHGCAGQPLLSAEPNRTQRPIILLLSCLAGDDEVERQNAEGWTKTRSRRVPPARGMCFACRYRLSFFPAAPAASSACHVHVYVPAVRGVRELRVSARPTDGRRKDGSGAGSFAHTHRTKGGWCRDTWANGGAPRRGGT